MKSRNSRDAIISSLSKMLKASGVGDDKLKGRDLKATLGELVEKIIISADKEVGKLIENRRAKGVAEKLLFNPKMFNIIKVALNSLTRYLRRAFGQEKAVDKLQEQIEKLAAEVKEKPQKGRHV